MVRDLSHGGGCSGGHCRCGGIYFVCLMSTEPTYVTQAVDRLVIGRDTVVDGYNSTPSLFLRALLCVLVARIVPVAAHSSFRFAQKSNERMMACYFIC
jgi:hypothetical protein